MLLFLAPQTSENEWNSGTKLHGCSPTLTKSELSFRSSDFLPTKREFRVLIPEMKTKLLFDFRSLNLPIDKYNGRKRQTQAALRRTGAMYLSPAHFFPGEKNSILIPNTSAMIHSSMFEIWWREPLFFTVQAKNDYGIRLFLFPVFHVPCLV